MAKSPSDKTDKNKKVKLYAKYSGLPYQLFGLIGVFGFIGYKLDTYFQNPKYYITACLILVGFTAFMFKLFAVLKSENE